VLVDPSDREFFIDNLPRALLACKLLKVVKTAGAAVYTVEYNLFTKIDLHYAIDLRGVSKSEKVHATRGFCRKLLYRSVLVDPSEKEFFNNNLLVQIHSIIEMIWWTRSRHGSLNPLFQVALHLPS